MTQHAHAETALYVCPMHPEVQQDGPGDCPKCGMHLVPKTEADAHAGHDHQCHHTDHKAPAGELDTVPAGFDGAVYTCPMHPEVRQPHAGSCPICGMGLELESATMDDGPNPELVDGAVSGPTSARNIW